MALQKIYIPRDVRHDLALALRAMRRELRVAKKLEAESPTRDDDYMKGYHRGMVTMAGLITRQRVCSRRFARQYAFKNAVAMEDINQTCIEG